MSFLREIVRITQGWGWAAITLRLAIAAVVGILIGLNRELKNRSAGIKTHVLVCVGSALATMTSEYVSIAFPGQGDINRIGAQVISGVGFLGVGTIIITGKKQVRGLTTAAGLWACACAGIAIGIGFIEGTVIATAMIIFTLIVLDRLDKFIHRHSRTIDLYLEFYNNSDINSLVSWMHEHRVRVDNINITRSSIKGEGPVATLTVIAPDEQTRSSLVEMLRESEFIRYSEEL